MPLKETKQKLVCNTLADKQVIINRKGEKIKWEYIKKLYFKEIKRRS